MKNFGFLYLLAPALIGSASAALVFTEDFDYLDGDLIGQNGGTGFTGAWTSPQATTGNIDVDSSAAHSNPNGPLQNTNVNRSFSGFSDSLFVFTLDYDVIVNAEGGYDFHVVLFDGNGLEILSVGNRNNQDGGGEFYVARVGTGGGFQTHQNIGAAGTFSDSMTISATISGSTITADITSTAFPAMDVTDLSRDLGSSIDFSSGGNLRIEKSGLDGMQITADTIHLNSIPEPSAFALFGLGSLGLLLRRRGC